MRKRGGAKGSAKGSANGSAKGSAKGSGAKGSTKEGARRAGVGGWGWMYMGVGYVESWRGKGLPPSMTTICR